MFSIDAMKDIVGKLGGLPGRKAILYVSDGLPMVAGEDLFYAIQEKYQNSSVLLQAHEFDSLPRFEELAAQANSNRVTFYTLDAAGLRPLSSMSAERQTAGGSTYIDTENIQNLQAPLVQLAERTGGRAIINTNDPGPALQSIGRELRSYYSLGYEPAHAGDGRYHRVEVKVKRRGVQVRHREGYRDKTVQQKMEEGTLAALLFGQESNSLGLKIGFGAPQRRDDGLYLVPVKVAIPLSSVVLVPQNQVHEGRVRLFMGAMDADGGMSSISNTPVSIEIPESDLERAKGMAYGYSVQLLMRGGDQKVAIGMRDEIGGDEAFALGRLRVEQ